MDELYQIPLFEGIADDELQWLIDNSTQELLERGDYFFEENAPVERFYIVLEGELQVSRTVDGKDLIMGTTPRGIMGGELALLNRTVSHVTVRAILPSCLMVFDEHAFLSLFAACPTVGMRILKTAAERTQGTVSILKQHEKMAALGKLSAGLAHELNNPAAAARRAAKTLHDLFPTLQTQTLQLNSLGLSKDQIANLITLQHQSVAKALAAQPLSPLEQTSREDEIGDWLDEQRIENGWDMAAAFVTADISFAALQDLAEQIPPSALETILNWLHNTLETTALFDEIEQSTGRISDLVGAIKSYTYMDQAPVQHVDMHEGIDNTLTVLRHKLRDVEVIREYDPDLPIISARGGELNQVWTNLIDNAIDAMGGEGQIRIVTRCEADFVMVEITDNGPGIPPEVLPRVFEPFFTTKEVGIGTGLGLDISYRIIQQHQGSIEVQSQPGQTRFIIRLPLNTAQE